MLLVLSPVLTELPDVVEQCEVLELESPEAVDNCNGTVTVFHDASLPITVAGIYTVNWILQRRKRKYYKSTSNNHYRRH